MQIKIIIVLLVIISSLSVAGFKYYAYAQEQMKTYIQNEAKFTVAIETQKNTINSLQQQHAIQVTALTNLSRANSKLYSEKTELSTKLMEHDLEELSRRKPALIETRINNGTKDLFDSFTSISIE